MLRTLEWFNIPFLFVALASMWTDRTVAHLWQRVTAYSLVAMLLAIGGWYWHLKILQVQRRRPLESQLRALLRIRPGAEIVLTIASLASAMSWTLQVGVTTDRMWATGLLVFAWAEYVNYFRYQLTHDTRADLRRLVRTRRLRPSWLARDLANLTRRHGPRPS
jgi:Kef-type K+ transport system membrane component KefB